MNIFKIEQTYLDLVNQILDADGEITPELETALAINKQDLELKAQGYGMLIKKMEAEIVMIKTETERLKKFATQREKLIESFKDRLSNAMQLYEVEKIDTPLLKLSFRKSESVEVMDIDLLDSTFINTEVVLTPNKALIKEAIKAGKNVLGAVLNTNLNLQIR